MKRRLPKICFLFLIATFRIGNVYGQLIFPPIYYPKGDTMNFGAYTANVWWSDTLKLHIRNAFLVINDFSKLDQMPDTFRFDGILFSKYVFYYFEVDTIDSTNGCSCVDTKSWYEDGKVESEILYVDSKGAYYRYYYPDGSIQSEGYIRKNSFSGLWKTYYKEVH
jgi:hypothetical protein